MPDEQRAAVTSARPVGARWSWLLPAGTFLAGCGLGAVARRGRCRRRRRPPRPLPAAAPGADASGRAPRRRRTGATGSAPAPRVLTCRCPTPACGAPTTRRRLSSTSTASWPRSPTSIPSGCARRSTTCSTSVTRLQRVAEQCRERRCDAGRRTAGPPRSRRPVMTSRGHRLDPLVARRRCRLVRAVARRRRRGPATSCGSSRDLGGAVADAGRSLGSVGTALQGLGDAPLVGKRTEELGAQVQRQLRGHRGAGAGRAGGSLRQLAVLLGLTVALLPSVPAVLLLVAVSRRRGAPSATGG